MRKSHLHIQPDFNPLDLTEFAILADQNIHGMHDKAQILARKRYPSTTNDKKSLETSLFDGTFQDQLSERYYSFLTTTIFRKTNFEQLDTDAGYLLPGHTKRIQQWSRLIAEHLGKDAHYCNQLSIAARFHDIGLQSLPKFAMHRWHEPNIDGSDFRHQLLNHVQSPYPKTATDDVVLKLIHDIILEHHERWDGQGYPRQKRHKEISLAARIVAVTHFVDELVSVNPATQRESLSIQEALDLLSMTACRFAS